MGSKFRGPMKEVLDQLQFYYPEVVKKLYIVNAPMLFRMLWKIVKPWLHPVTVASIDIVGGKFHDTFRKNGIPLSQLPQYLGGERVAEEGELWSFVESGCNLPSDLRDIGKCPADTGGVGTPRHTPMTPRKLAEASVDTSDDEFFDAAESFSQLPLNRDLRASQRGAQARGKFNRFQVVETVPVDRAPTLKDRRKKRCGCCGGNPSDTPRRAR